MSFTERRAAANKHPWTLPQLAEADELIRPITHAPPGNFSKPTAKTMGKVELAKRKNDYFEGAFSVRGDRNPVRERIRSDSIVVVELRTNVIIGDEFIFITELSAKLAERYRRPLSSIVVHVQHSQCIFFAGTFEPAYFVTISALTQYVQPATNRRNAYMVSEHLDEALGVPPPRGFINFVALPEENIACNGKTIAQALDDTLEAGGPGMGVIEEEKSVIPVLRRKRLSAKSLSNIRAHAGPVGDITPPTSSDDGPGSGLKPAKVARRRKSFVAGLFGRSGVKRENSNKENSRNVDV